MANSYFTIDKHPNGITRIGDLFGAYCFLVEGEKKALLIDCLMGIKGLKEIVHSLTDLPIELVVTHGHLDHLGGVFEFGSCYLHPADYGFVDSEMLSLPSRMDATNNQLKFFGGGKELAEDEFVQNCPIECKPLAQGMVFDLGGRALEVIEVAGHTAGSVCFLDRKTGDFFAGDACNSNTLIISPFSTTISVYLASLKALKKRQAEIENFYCFHGVTPVSSSCIDDNIENCENILAHKDDHVPASFMGNAAFLSNEREGYDRKDGKFGNIMYTEDLVK